MRYKKLMLFFSVSLPFAVLLRFFQLEFIIDSTNGFFTTDNQTFGLITTILLFVIALLLCVFSFTTHRCPEHPPKPNLYLVISSLALSGVIFYDTFFVKAVSEVSPIFNTLRLIFAICTIIFTLCFAAQNFITIKIPSFCYLLPCFYMILKTIIEFTRISTIAVITDNLFLIAALCSITVFFLQFAKLYNQVDTEKNFRKILASGLVSIFFCLLQSVAFFFFNIVSGYKNIHTSVSANIILFFFGLFLLSFILSHFSKKNSCDK